jgi:hypothetical protein
MHQNELQPTVCWVHVLVIVVAGIIVSFGWLGYQLSNNPLRAAWPRY